MLLEQNDHRINRVGGAYLLISYDKVYFDILRFIYSF